MVVRRNENEQKYSSSDCCLDQTSRSSCRGFFQGTLKGNVKIAFGAYSGVSAHGANTSEFELMVKYGVKEAHTIKSATPNAADLLDMQGRLGSIEKGKYADIIAVTGDPLKDISLLKSIDFVMKDGSVYKQ